MVGNDVVDLLDPETRPASCHARFDERVFAPGERDALRASAAPGRLRWLLWAAKEAAYKVAKKQDPRTVLSPRAFVVRLTGDGHGVVEHDGVRSFALRVDPGRAYVHAVATAGCAPHATLVAAVERLPAGSTVCPGAAARRLALATIAARLGAAADVGELAIVRDGKVPRLVRASGARFGDLSLSHHGHFVAFACELPAAGGDARDAA
jgi:phosphopantetheinyl transferase (holo-ACP synthase)